VLSSQSRGAEIKLPVGAGITNCGPGSYLFTTEEILLKKITIAEKGFENC
jgi:hypothetical protein